jgi:hypothetical protein
VLKLSLALAVGLLVSSSSDAARLCESKKHALKVRDACKAQETDHGPFAPGGDFVPRDEFDGAMAMTGESIASLSEGQADLEDRVGGLGATKLWKQADGHIFISSGNDAPTVVHETQLPAGKWLVGAKIDVVNNDTPGDGEIIDSYYRCYLVVNGVGTVQSGVLMGDNFTHELHTLTLFDAVDGQEPIDLKLTCRASNGAARIPFARPYVESGRLWAISASEVSEF